MSYTQSYTRKNENKIEIINKLPEVLPTKVSDNSTSDNTQKLSSITGTLVSEWILYWPDLFQEPLVSKPLIKRRLTDPLYGREKLNRKIQDMATNTPSIERIWQITEKLPSLTDILCEERDAE